MNLKITFGIIGGYGATGGAVVSELLRTCNAEILVGGRDMSRATASAAKFAGRVSAAQVDVLDARSLDDFCERCSVIVNCAGPVMLLQDRVAQAAFRKRCHYIDLAGLTFVKERMLSQATETANLGLSFVISSGWMPGLSELVPVYAHAQAKGKLETIESVTVYFGDSGEWSTNALRDGAWFLHKAGLRRPGYFHKGEWARVKLLKASQRVNLGEPIGSGHFSLFSTPELEEVGRRLNDCDVFVYSYLSGFRTALAATSIALLPLPESLGVRLLQGVFRRNRLPVDGFVVAQVRGLSLGRRHVFTVQIAYKERRDYWINGLVPSITARMISEGKSVRPGVHFLADAVDPGVFKAELRKAGVEQSEKFEPCE